LNLASQPAKPALAARGPLGSNQIDDRQTPQRMAIGWPFSAALIKAGSLFLASATLTFMA
jgi:hypothetical protein